MIKKLSIFLFALTFIGKISAFQLPSNISPKQIEQFKKLPPAQQKQLAQSMGIDYQVLKSQLNKSNTNNFEEEAQEHQYYPRGTQFDEFGSPTFEERVEDKDEIKGFGYDVFANAPYTFAPNLDVAVPENYIIGAGDELSVQMFGKENFEYQIAVNREGKIVLPELGVFKVAGLTFQEAKSYLSKQIKNKVLGVEVALTLSNLRSIRVFVLGDAFKPGPYILSSLSSITHALFAAGGINDIGSLRNIQLKRAGKLVTTFDAYDLLINGDSSNDLLLKSGDVIFIGAIGDTVTVDGEVKRPAIYEISEDDTFDSVVKMAGGLLPSAYPSATVVERFNKQNLRTMLNVDLTTQDSRENKVRAGDVVKVTKTSEMYESSISIIGAASRPGKYQWEKGLKVSDIIPDIHANLLADADLSYSLIIREKDIGRNIEVLQFSLFNALADKNSKDNLELNARDRILIFSNVEIPTTDISSLDDIALTKAELIEMEKEEAEEKFKEKLFWMQYGEDSDPLTFNKTKKVDQAEETLKKTFQSIEEITGANNNREPELRELNFFSRKRMLAPVIEQLRRQAASGQPMQLVEIDGAVKHPGLYPLANNIRTSDLVRAAGGLLESAYLKKSEITRNSLVNGIADIKTIKLNLSAALSKNISEDHLLESKDRLNVHHIPAWQEHHIVELKGEFVFPGKYTIRRGESLGELIKRVGGFTDYAHTGASLFTRERLKQLELKNLVKISESLRMEIASKSLSSAEGNQSIDYKQAKLLLADLTKVKPVGRLVVDIPKVVEDSQFDVLLEDGDVLFVPSKQNSVNVIGQVQVSSSHIYQDGLDAKAYLALSGGAKKQADMDRMYVIKANGSVEIPQSGNWFSEASGNIQPGDTVVVPLDSAYMEDITLWATATQIVYQAAVAIAAISNI